MNSYPAELLVQLAPVMFVAGLSNLSPGPSTDQLAGTPATPASEAQGPIAPTPRRATSSDPFALLVQRLREALGSQRKPAIWVPDQVRKSKTFQVVFVDKVCIRYLANDAGMITYNVLERIFNSLRERYQTRLPLSPLIHRCLLYILLRRFTRTVS